MDLYTDLSKIIPQARILSRPIDRIAYASDASLYSLIPQVVVLPDSVDEIRSLFNYSSRSGIPLVFRTGGTSLAGQSITDGILVEVARHWRGMAVEEGGKSVRLQPGVVGTGANNVLRAYRKRIGPDPASIDSAMIGGIVSNNASGMCCGVSENSYQTLLSAVMVLPNGLVLDSADPQAEQKLIAQTPLIAQGLLDLKRRIDLNPALKSRVIQKYKTKNTTGYSLNALVDFQSPVDILSHLMVGAEGTLGFLAEVSLKGLPLLTYKYTSLLYFQNIQAACDAVPALRDSGARAIEIMDRASLRSVENQTGAPEILKTLPPGATGLLVEYQSDDAAVFEGMRHNADRVCAGLTLLYPAVFTEDPHEQAHLWKIRKGGLPSVGAMRPQGGTVIIEDVAFPLQSLAAAILDLQKLFDRFNYANAVIFGHAKDGNIHFVITPCFDRPGELDNYAAFMSAVNTLVVERYDGALKAEHGTGRNVAPFVELEWGQEAHQIMKDLKNLLDPQNILNPGVIINPDPNAHLQHIKSMPKVEEEVDKCMECGFCEPTCPSHELTLSPRRRIVVRREIARLRASGSDPLLLAGLLKDYAYDGMDTCAADGLCGVACPVEINTGLMIKRLRTEKISPRGQSNALWVERHFTAVERSLRFGLGLGHFASSLLGVKGVVGVTRAAEKISGAVLPKWTEWMPRPNTHWKVSTHRESAQAVYFPACISRVMSSSPEKGGQNLPEVFLLLCHRAGVNVWQPEDAEGLCCGMPFSSKGCTDAAHEMARQLLNKLWAWSYGGRLPVVTDTSSCAMTLKTSGDLFSGEDLSRWKKLTLLDTVEFVHDTLLPRLKVTRLPISVAIHPNCSARKMNLDGKLVSIIQACTAEAKVPLALGCDGFAGDRGFLFPELTASATIHEAEEVLIQPLDGYYSSNLTCEIGMRMATRKPYRSFLYLVEEATR